MRIVMTLMVRDEADVIGAMIEHHRQQGIDHVIVTDNASIDGTTEILEELASTGFITLLHDPVHRKQQWSVVTAMARQAATTESADWVINADADEFWLPSRSGATVRSLLEAVDPAVPYLTVPVVNLTGAPAKDGAGFARLRYRDHRTDAELHAAGIPFHPTANALHRGNPLVEISQGNHFVSAPGWGEGEVTTELEVLHLPWRSWRQYENKVRTSGEAYTSNPTLAPSPRHHGMQDYRRLLGGRLESIYVAKHPSPDEIEVMIARGSLAVDDRLTALAVGDQVPADVPYAGDEAERLRTIGRQFTALEAELEDRLRVLTDEQAFERSLWLVGQAESTTERDELKSDLDSALGEISRLAGELAHTNSRLTVRTANRLAETARAVRKRMGR